jgi:group II intron reverse transcriptase/maturase
MAIGEILNNLNNGFEWVIDLDIEKYFDTVNHDKLISILRENVNDSHTLHLIRKFLQAGVMENGLTSASTVGVPQGGPLSPILSNIYLDKFDKELEYRGLNFVRYADDCNIFVRSEKSANRVMTSVTSWLERKLFLKVSATKTKIVRPSDSNFLGFTFWNSKSGWQCKPQDKRKGKLIEKIKIILKRKHAVSRPLGDTFTKLNQIIKGWINYFKIGNMKTWIEDTFGPWLRHKVRVIIVKQWKKPKTIYENLMKINKAYNGGFTDEEICSVANTRLGWYRQCCTRTINYLISADLLSKPNKKRNRPGLVNPLLYYLR